jgi:hypothetical protein
MKKKVAKKTKLSQSPTQLSLRWLRDRLYTAQVVERWNPHARIRQDLFGWCDIIALGGNKIVGIQTTSRANVWARGSKILESKEARDWLLCDGEIRVHGWDKHQGRIRLQITVIALMHGTMCKLEAYDVPNAFCKKLDE